MHYLRRNHSTRTPSDLVFLDTETLPHDMPGREGRVIHKLRLGVAIAGRLEGRELTRRQVFRFRSAETFWRWLEGRLSVHRPTHLFAHNLAFDLTSLRFWEQLESGEYTLKDTLPDLSPPSDDGVKPKARSGLLVMEDPPTIVRCYHRQGGSLVALDTLNWWRCSLAELGREHGVLKMEMPRWADPDEDWFRYCEQDCRVIEAAVTSLMSWVRDNDLGVFKWTAASQAMAAFRHRWMAHDILIHGHPTVRRLERAAYFGGEVAVNKLGPWEHRPDYFFPNEAPTSPGKPSLLADRVTVCDVTAAYPFVMGVQRYPHRLESLRMRPSLEDAHRACKIWGGVGLVKVRSRDRAYPVRTEQGVLYATGTYWTALAGPELYRALGLGDVVHVEALSLYSTAPLFEQWSKDTWAMRMKARSEGRTQEEALCKMLMNSLYGKFAQKSPRWEHRPEVASPCPWGPWHHIDDASGLVRSYLSVGWSTLERGEEGDHPESFTAISAFVTSHLRELMRYYRDSAGRDGWLYQDTDSLFLTSLGRRRLQDRGMIGEKEMGCLRVVGEYSWGEIRGAKDYCLEGRDVISGVRKNAVLLGAGHYGQDRFQRLRDILSRQPLDGVVVDKETLTLQRVYTRGKPDANGWVTPHCLDRPHMTDELSDILRPEEVAREAAGGEGHDGVVHGPLS